MDARRPPAPQQARFTPQPLEGRRPLYLPPFPTPTPFLPVLTDPPKDSPRTLTTAVSPSATYQARIAGPPAWASNPRSDELTTSRADHLLRNAQVREMLPSF